ncbi:hypothetical protein SI65_03140 [Aspergillus cristatus]|uniref:Uncharacterized protein n=1 Tax=Aspergillus cristatus TaxID=573508 RepID=A0A1E3BMU5_ASPCR|nr:hypothetical protein SI65_03140 [Aspergillus cristatus]
MPVTLTRANHAAQKWAGHKCTTSDELLQRTCPKEIQRSKGIIQSSFTELLQNNQISATRNGFVEAIYHAYSHHHHLTLRPEDVWFSILSQLAFFINAHAEKLRSLFVKHQGQKELKVFSNLILEQGVDIGELAVDMASLIEEHLADPELRTLIMPAFSTTTGTDRVVAATLMMGGPFRMTLLGNREDWAQLVTKLDKIPRLGKEPANFTRILQPVLEGFVACFDRPDDPAVIDFWHKCAHKSGGSGTQPVSPSPPDMREFGSYQENSELDKVLSHRIDMEDLPCEYTSVPVTVDNNGTIYKTQMIAGLIGIQATSSGRLLDQTKLSYDRNGRRVSVATIQEPGLDSIQPVSGWWMFEKDGAEEEEARKKERKVVEDELKASESAEPSLDKWDKLERKYALRRRLEELK